MQSIRFVAFRGRSFVSKAIRFVTRSKHYSHIGYLTSSGVLVECWPNPKNPFQRWCFSSFDNHKPGTLYEIWQLDVSDANYWAIDVKLKAMARNRVKYNWLGCLGFVVKVLGSRPGRFFCSEGCVAPLVQWLGWDAVTPSHVSPQDFVELLDAAGATRTKRGAV